MSKKEAAPTLVNPNKVVGAFPDRVVLGLGVDELREPIIVRFARYKGRERISIRAHYRKNGVLNPGRRGIEVPREYLDELIEALERVRGDLEEAKL